MKLLPWSSRCKSLFKMAAALSQEGFLSQLCSGKPYFRDFADIKKLPCCPHLVWNCHYVCSSHVILCPMSLLCHLASWPPTRTQLPGLETNAAYTCLVGVGWGGEKCRRCKLRFTTKLEPDGSYQLFEAFDLSSFLFCLSVYFYLVKLLWFFLLQKLDGARHARSYGGKTPPLDSDITPYYDRIKTCQCQHHLPWIYMLACISSTAIS